MKRILIVPLSVVVASCATPVADPNPSTSVQAVESVPVAQPAPGNDSHSDTAASQGAKQQAAQRSSAPSDEMMADNDTPQSFQGIEELEAPAVDEVPPAMIPGRVEPETSVVCERIYPTGSILPTRVCRDKAEIAKKEEYDREMFDDIKRNTAIGNARL